MWKKIDWHSRSSSSARPFTHEFIVIIAEQIISIVYAEFTHAAFSCLRVFNLAQIDSLAQYYQKKIEVDSSNFFYAG